MRRILLVLLALFIGVPVIELAILIELGQWIGLLPTLVLVFATGIAGAALARSQGFSVWLRMRRELEAGRMPVGNLLDGLLILIGGIVLLTPGLLTDLFGLALLLPFTRAAFKRYLRHRLQRMLDTGQVSMFTLIR